MIRVIAFIVAASSFAACTETRNKMIEHFTPDYQADTDAPPPESLDVQLVPVLKGVTQATDIQFPPDMPTQMYVTRKTGELVWFDLAQKTRRHLGTFDVLTASEQGLLGLAFHPDFAENRQAFVNLSRSGDDGDESAVLRITITLNEKNQPTGYTVVEDIYVVAQPYTNHNAGQLAFGPDGTLYVGWGDGGWRDDPHENGQNGKTALGSMLRIDVDRKAGGKNYAIPDDNPFVGNSAYLPETWAIGLRNPWRYSFAPDGRLVVADVGQNLWEEVDIVVKGGNYGWNVREGAHCFSPKEDCPTDNLIDPVWEYGRDEGQSITGGYVYGGTAVTGLQGRYVVADFVSGRMWAFVLPESHTDTVTQITNLGKWSMLFSTFGSNVRDLFVADFGQGAVYRLE